MRMSTPRHHTVAAGVTLLMSAASAIAQVGGDVPDLGTAPRLSAPIAPTGTPVAPGVTPRAPAAVDTTSRAAVIAAYQAMQPHLAHRDTWDGSVDPCNPGTEQDADQAAVQATINGYRSLAGVPPITIDRALDGKALAAALIMDAEFNLSHSPPSTWKCYTALGAEGAGKSNLAIGVAGTRAISLYMEDPGENNKSVGHRSWILNPRALAIGNGSTNRGNALVVVTPGAASVPVGVSDWLAWPTAGFFPAPFDPAVGATSTTTTSRWSLHHTGSADLSHATVAVSTGGKPLQVSTPVASTGYGNLQSLGFDVTFDKATGDRVFDVTVNGITIGGTTTSHSYSVTYFDPATATTPEWMPVDPWRAMDTRPNTAGPDGINLNRTIDGEHQNGGRVEPGSPRSLKIVGRNNLDADQLIPATNTTAVVVNVTVVNPANGGYLTVWPTGQPQPTASTHNYVPGQVTSNMVVTALGTDGTISLAAGVSAADLVVDVVGFIPKTAHFAATNPARILETRTGDSAYTTADGQHQGTGRLDAGSVYTLPIAGRAGSPANAVAAVVNVTAVSPENPGFVTAYPGGTRPTASTVNTTPGRATPNMTVAPLASDGSLSLYVSEQGATDLVVDLYGWYTADSTYHPVTPARLLETRSGHAAYKTVDGAQQGIGARVTDTTHRLPVVGRGSVPADGVRAVVVNVTSVAPRTGGYLTVWGKRDSRFGTNAPGTSTLNYIAGAVTAVHTIVPVTDDGEILYRTGVTDTELVVDVIGWM